MIEGYVNDALEPVAEIGLKQGKAVTTILATVDTGFSGAFGFQLAALSSQLSEGPLTADR